MAETRKSVRDRSDDSDLRRQAEAEVRAMLGRAVPIRATTLSDALAEAEIIRLTENILVAMNSLWAWYNDLPLAGREEIGRFDNKRRFQDHDGSSETSRGIDRHHEDMGRASIAEIHQRLMG